MSLLFYTGSAWKDVQNFYVRTKAPGSKTSSVRKAQIFDGVAWKVYYEAGGNLTAEYVGIPQSGNPANIDKFTGYSKGEFGTLNRGQYVGGVEVLMLYQYENGGGIGFVDGYHLALGADLPIDAFTSLTVQNANGTVVTLPVPTDEFFYGAWDGTKTAWVFFYDLRNNRWVDGHNYDFEINL